MKHVGRNQEDRIVKSKLVRIEIGEEIPESRVILHAVLQQRKAEGKVLGRWGVHRRVEGNLDLDTDGEGSFQVPSDLGIAALIINRGGIHLDKSLAGYQRGNQKGELTYCAFLDGR